MTNVKTIDMTAAEVGEVLAYDPETGSLTWRITPGRRIKAGMEAGQAKSTHAGGPRYRYVTIRGMQTTAARVAWLLSYGEWPEATVQYRDGDTLNIRLANLKLSDFPTVKTERGGRRVYKMSKTAQRHYGLMRYYGLTGEEYGLMVAAQNGVCAICHQPETAMLNGVPKVMHVDHHHESGQLRALLCGSCNGMLGLAKDSSEVLRAAADYLDHHAAKRDNVEPFRVIGGERAADGGDS